MIELFNTSERKYKKIIAPIATLFGGGSSTPAPAPIIMPAPVEKKEYIDPTKDDSQAQEIKKREDLIRQEAEDRRAKRTGRKQSIFAGRGLGNTQQVSTASKTLLGE